MKAIPLTQGQVALVDDSDATALTQFHWYAARTHHIFYAVRKSQVNGKQRTIQMHRELLRLSFGDKRQADHRDGDGLNNQRSNLRICSRTENTRNQCNQRRAKGSQYKGVCWRTAHRLWQARIMVNGKAHSLGYFPSETAAALAYNAAATRFFGEFARPNLVERS